MKISEILSAHPVTLSFEVFPPKTEAGVETVEAAAREIAALGPHFMSVTYGADGGASAYTARVASDIQNGIGTPVLAHLTCVAATKEKIGHMLDTYRDCGVNNIMALRGDIPEGGRSCFDYQYAADLVRAIKEADPAFCVGGACYPEVHPESANQREDILHLREKVDAGCDFLTTQMFFDNNLLYNFLYKLREAGVTVPVLPGIMPITKGNQVKRAIALSGAHMPQRFKALVDKFGSDPAAMKQAGIVYATDQIIDLFANGVGHVHVYTMNDPSVARGILANLSDILAMSRS